MKRKRPSGFSLLEVILATAILLACLIVLGQMAYVGRKHAQDAADLTTAQLICRTKLNEILIGAAPVAAVETQPVADVPGWAYSVDVQPLDRFGLVSLRVTVSQQPSERESTATPRSGKQFTLTRWMHDSSASGEAAGEADWLGGSRFDSFFGGGSLP